MTCNRSPNKTASCLVGRMTHASPGMSVVHLAGMATRRGGMATRRGGMATRRGGMATRRGGMATRRGGMATRRGGALYTATVTSPRAKLAVPGLWS